MTAPNTPRVAPLHAPLHAPKIIFLLRLMLCRRSCGKAYRAEIRWNSSREKSARLFRSRSNRFGVFRFNPPGWNAVALTVSLPNQLEDVMVVNMLDFVCQDDDLAI